MYVDNSLHPTVTPEDDDYVYGDIEYYENFDNKEKRY